MSMCKSSMTMGALAEKTTDWTKVLDEELATDIDDMDSAEEAEKCQKEEEVRQQREAEEKWKQEAKERKQAAAAEAKKQQQADSEAQVRKMADEDNDDKIIMLSGQKTKQQGGSGIHPHGCGHLERITSAPEQWLADAAALHAHGRAGGPAAIAVVKAD
ncbi:hypothetical protein ID866_9947 [Astraeus odoratus]|nr:hypothetical protein ID866_9947 [Astraeus odoratus]